MASTRPKPAIVIPTYWTKPDGVPTDRLLNIYDHPTPLGTPGTLGRTLESLRRLDGEFSTVVVATVTEPELSDELERVLRDIVVGFPELDPVVFGPAKLAAVRRRVEEMGAPDLAGYLSLDGYSNVRNLCLLVPHVLGHEVAILVDDDEVIEQTAFVSIALEYMGEKLEGEVVLAKAGYYVKPGDDYMTPKRIPWWDWAWRKGEYMARALRALRAEPRLKSVPLALGGNLVVHRQLFEQVCFDPYMLRGEDCDFLVNARLKGFSFFGDNKMCVLHLPPPHLAATFGSRQDVYRFVYGAAKLLWAAEEPDLRRLGPNDFDPYPGPFLHPNVRWKSAATSLLLALRDIGEGSSRAHLANARIALIEAPRYAREHRGRFFELLRRWPELLRRLAADPEITRIVRSRE